MKALDYLKRDGIIYYRLRGMGMFPMLRPGDIVELVTPEEDPILRKYDIVLFLRPSTGKPALMRVVESGPEGYTLRGDRLLSTETNVYPGAVLARMTGYVRYSRVKPVDTFFGRLYARLIVAWGNRKAKKN